VATVHAAFSDSIPAIRRKQKVFRLRHQQKSLLHVFGSVVSGAEWTALRVGKLRFDHVGGRAQAFHQDRSGHRAKAVRCHFLVGVTQSPKRRPEGVFTHGPAFPVQAGEDVLAVSSQGSQISQHFNGLRCERYEVGAAVCLFVNAALHLH